MKRWTLSLISCASILALLLIATPSIAEDELDLEAIGEERAEKRERYKIRKLTQERLNPVTEFIEDGQYDDARIKLEKMKFKRLNANELASTYKFLAYAHMGLEQQGRAVGYFEKVLEQEIVPVTDEAIIRFTITQIHAGDQNWEKVEEALHEWFKYVDKSKLNGNGHFLLSISHYRRDQFDKALVPALKALELSGKKPQERFLQLVVALYLQTEDYSSSIPILESLLTNYPKKQYWIQLALIYGAEGDYEGALRIQQLAYTQNLLTKNDELRRLARTLLYHQLPYSAAQVLERGLEENQIEMDRDVLELLGNSWIAAREYERSLGPLQRAADMADDGSLYLRLGQVRVQREDWTEATALIEKALKKGGLEDEGRAQLLLGISHYSDDHTESARSAFLLAQKHESSRKDAKAWLDHIARQIREEG